LIEEKPAKVVLDIISDFGIIMGLCLGASLMSFVELFDLAFNCLFICCGCKDKRVENNEEGFAEKTESDIRLESDALIKICINKIACLETELSTTRELVLKLIDKPDSKFKTIK